MAVACPADSNATSNARHALLVQRMAATVGNAGKDSQASNGILVLNTIDHHYVDIIGSWKAMVSTAPFAKQMFVVAMDTHAAAACQANDLAHYLPDGDASCSGLPTSSAPQPGSYHRVKIQGKEADTRVLPPDLPSWKMHAVWAGLSSGWRVLFSESDALWLPPAPGQPFSLASHLLHPAAAEPHDFAPQRHPMTPVWNFGFFLAQGGRAASFFECGVRQWEHKQLSARRSGHPVNIGSDQRFLWDLWRRRACGALRVRKLPLGLYPTCRDWVGRRDALVVHVTYCHRLSMLLSAEDRCKQRVLAAFYTHTHSLGGINITSEQWNTQLGC